jgi:hypothetical protein
VHAIAGSGKVGRRAQPRRIMAGHRDVPIPMAVSDTIS